MSTHDLSPICLAATTAAIMWAGKGFPMATLCDLNSSLVDVWGNRVQLAYHMNLERTGRRS